MNHSSNLHRSNNNPIRSISIAAPAYNEENNIKSVVLGWQSYLNTLHELDDYEIVICDDGSIDKTKDILASLSLSNNKVKIISLAKNQGAAAALSKAIENTIYDWILLIDSDGQFPIENLTYFLNDLDKSIERSIGYKGSRKDKKDSFFMRFGSKWSGKLLNVIYHTKYQDFNSAFMFIKASVLKKINLEAKGLNYSTDITGKLAEMGLVLKEIEIEQIERQGSLSSKKAFVSAVHRFFFVMYLIFRRILLKMDILKV